MKIMRYFPLIALAILGFILYGLFKTSSFVNKKVDAKTLLSQDSIVKHAADSAALSTNSVIADTLSTPAIPAVTTTIAPSVQANRVKTEIAVEPQHHSSSTKKDPASAESTRPAPTHAPTSLAPPTVGTAVKTPILTESSKKVTVETPKTDATKQGQARGIVKAPLTKTTPSTSSITVVAKGDVPKSASVTVTKEIPELRFHVIIGSYGQEVNAKAKATAFEQKNNKKATIIKQGGYFRVCADEFEFAQAASQYAQKLKEAGEDNLILKF